MERDNLSPQKIITHNLENLKLTAGLSSAEVQTEERAWMGLGYTIYRMRQLLRLRIGRFHLDAAWVTPVKLPGEGTQP